ncbi:hypothetical protein EON81_17630 [bacterium]|nr:MAG: hypothetical protein EON81_17630 [bacterium]
MIPFLLALQQPKIESVRVNELYYGKRSDRTSVLGRAALSGYGDLRKHRLPIGDEEVRVWGGFGTTLIQGVVLRKKGSRWTAIRLLSAPKKPTHWGLTKTYQMPRSGWPRFWKLAEHQEIFTLPDESELPQKGKKQVLDGFSFLVEIQRKGRYRAYFYSNPKFQTQWPQAKRILEIDALLDREFIHPAAVALPSRT